MTKQELNKAISEKGEQTINGVTYYHADGDDTIFFKCTNDVRGFVSKHHHDDMYISGFLITEFDEVISLIKSVAKTLEIDISSIPLIQQKDDRESDDENSLIDVLRQTAMRLEGKVEVYEKLTTNRKVTLE